MQDAQFVAITVSLGVRKNTVLSTADSPYAHAAILSRMSEADPVIGRRLHDTQRHKHFTLGIIDSSPGTAVLRGSFVGQDALTDAKLLIDVLSKQGSLQMGRMACIVNDMTIENGLWSGLSTWADITAPSDGHHLQFHFATPTAITKRDGFGDRVFALFPEPLDIFVGLSRRWQALRGPILPSDLSDFLNSQGCVTASYKLGTEEFFTRERTQIGFVGSVTYECRTLQPMYLHALQALTRLAFFTGVGYQTARGMGLVQTAITQ